MSSPSITFRLCADLRDRLRAEVEQSERLSQTDIIIIALQRYLDARAGERASPPTSDRLKPNKTIPKNPRTAAGHHGRVSPH